VFLVAPKAVKNFMGKGTFEKNDMAFAAKRKYGFVHENDNIVDAFCLTRYLVANLEGQVLPLVKHSPLLQYACLQVPAPNEQSLISSPLTTSRAKPTLPIAFRRIPVPPTKAR
jgi:hypothetical protein